MCDTNNIHESATIWVLPFFVKNALATTLCSHTSVSADNTLDISSNSTAKTLIQKKHLWSYSIAGNYHLKKFANNHAIDRMDSRISRYIQTAQMTPVRYVDDLYELSCKVAVVYKESNPNEIFIEGIDPSICHSLWEYWATHPRADVTSISFKPQSLLEIQKGGTNPASPKIKPYIAKPVGRVFGRSHLLKQSRLDHRCYQHIHPDTARDLFWHSHFTHRLYLTRDWSPFHRPHRYHRLRHLIERSFCLF